MPDYYEVLYLSRDASPAEIAGSIEFFREKLSGYAPGVFITDDLIRSNYPIAWDAFATLIDPVAKAAYDESITPRPAVPALDSPATEKNYLPTYLSYAAAIGMFAALVLFFAILGDAI